MKPTSSKAFTLVELLVTIVILAILATIGFSGYNAIKLKALCVKDIAQMRKIGNGVLARAAENNGYFYTREEIGNSSFRAYEDRFSLCQVIDPWLEDEQVWMSPRPNPKLVRYGNTYAWSRAPDVTQKSLGMQKNLGKLLLIWNAHTFTIPSVRNVAETASNGGPRNASKQYYYYPWKNGTAINWLYADGHVETR